MKKTIFALILIFIILPDFALAQAVGSSGTGSGAYVPLAPIPGLDTTVSTGAGGLGAFLNNLYIYLIGIAVVLAIVEIIWGGLEITTKDSVSKNRDGKDRIWRALLGLALVLLPVLVFTIINPSILQLNINMPPLNLSQYSGLNGTSSGTTTCNSTNCLDPNKPSIIGEVQTGTTVTACTTPSCKNAFDQCTAGTPTYFVANSQAVCTTSSGNSTPATNTGGFFSGPNYTCPQGSTLSMTCNYVAAPVNPSG